MAKKLILFLFLIFWKKKHDQAFVRLANILNAPHTSANIKHYAEKIKQASVDRQLKALSQEIIKVVRDNKDHRLDYLQKKFNEIADDSLSSAAPVLVNDVLKEVIESPDERKNNPSIVGLNTGFSKFDDLTHGLQAGHLIILAARPSMGKTLLGMNIAEHIAVNEQKTVLLFSLEMNKNELIERSLSSLCGINQNAIKSGNLETSDWEKISLAAPKYHSANLFIEDNSGSSVADIRAKARKIQRERGLSLIVVDYLGLLSGDGENETDRISKISRSLKLLARDLNVPVLVLSQLNRGVESRQDKRPTMADIRQSGAIEQDADLILFIYRDEVYNPNSGYKGLAEINIAKNRHGCLGNFYLKFNGQYCRFENHFGEVVEPKKIKTPHFYGFVS